MDQDGARKDEVYDELTIFAGAWSASRSRERRARPVSLQTTDHGSVWNMLTGNFSYAERQVEDDVVRVEVRLVVAIPAVARERKARVGRTPCYARTGHAGGLRGQEDLRRRQRVATRPEPDGDLVFGAQEDIVAACRLLSYKARTLQ